MGLADVLSPGILARIRPKRTTNWSVFSAVAGLILDPTPTGYRRMVRPVLGVYGRWVGQVWVTKRTAYPTWAELDAADQLFSLPTGTGMWGVPNSRFTGDYLPYATAMTGVNPGGNPSPNAGQWNADNMLPSGSASGGFGLCPDGRLRAYWSATTTISMNQSPLSYAGTGGTWSSTITTVAYSLGGGYIRWHPASASGATRYFAYGVPGATSGQVAIVSVTPSTKTMSAVGSTPSWGTATVNEVMWSPGGNAIFVTFTGSPYVKAYKWTGSAWGTEITIPSTPTGNCWGIDFSPGGDYLLITWAASPYIHVYPWNESTQVVGSKVADHATGIAPYAASWHKAAWMGNRAVLCVYGLNTVVDLRERLLEWTGSAFGSDYRDLNNSSTTAGYYPNTLWVSADGTWWQLGVNTQSSGSSSISVKGLAPDLNLADSRYIGYLGLESTTGMTPTTSPGEIWLEAGERLYIMPTNGPTNSATMIRWDVQEVPA